MENGKRQHINTNKRLKQKLNNTSSLNKFLTFDFK